MRGGKPPLERAIRLMGAAALLAAASFLLPAASEAAPKLFGTVEFRMPPRNGDGWASVLKRNASHPVFAQAESFLSRSTTWGKLRSHLEGKPFMEKLDAVNRFWNASPYRSDREAYGKDDYWAAPYEFVSRSGDCEDYCIVKYFTLKALGVSVDSMRIVVVRETIRGIGHAVLAVYEGENIWILDNLADNVRSSRRIRNYIPQYSLNEKKRWSHVRPH